MKRWKRWLAILTGCGISMSVGCTTLPSRSCETCGPSSYVSDGPNNTANKGYTRGAGGYFTGNEAFKQLYDPCWPERYSSLARRAVNHATAPQVMNGHVLDQTVWNHHFEPGTDKLTETGLAHLQYVSRRRPCPDPTVYLATAMDLKYDPAVPERYAGARQELDTLRIASVQKYLTAVNIGRSQEFEIRIHDPADVSIHSIGAASSVQQMYGRYRGGLPVQVGGGSNVNQGGGGAGGGAGNSAPTGTGTGR